MIGCGLNFNITLSKIAIQWSTIFSLSIDVTEVNYTSPESGWPGKYGPLHGPSIKIQSKSIAACIQSHH